MKEREQFSVSLPLRERRKLDRLAREDGRTRTGYVQRILLRHLAEQEAKAA